MTLFRYLTAGESHGKALTGILEGIPSGIELRREQIETQLKRRKLGFGRSARQKIESDEVEILSGVRFGKTLGSPISLLIRNKDWQSWQDILQVEPNEKDLVKREVHIPRPGHADLIGGIKYAHSDMRNVLERSSARETAMRVALGSLARVFLGALDIHVASRVIQIGNVRNEKSAQIPISKWNELADQSPVRCLDKEFEPAMIEEVESAKKEGNTVGGEFEVCAEGIPVGLGSYIQWDRRIEGQIAQAFLSLNAIKGVEVGIGFESARLPGSQVHDAFLPGKGGQVIQYASNKSGGVDGGMTTGQPIIVRAAMKPLATLMTPLSSVDLRNGEAAFAHVERSDVCAVPAAAVIGESLLALVLTEAILDKFGGDSIQETRHRVYEWKKSCPI